MGRDQTRPSDTGDTAGDVESSATSRIRDRGARWPGEHTRSRWAQIGMPGETQERSSAGSLESPSELSAAIYTCVCALVLRRARAVGTRARRSVRSARIFRRGWSLTSLRTRRRQSTAPTVLGRPVKAVRASRRMRLRVTAPPAVRPIASTNLPAPTEVMFTQRVHGPVLTLTPPRRSSAASVSRRPLLIGRVRPSGGVALWPGDA